MLFPACRDHFPDAVDGRYREISEVHLPAGNGATRSSADTNLVFAEIKQKSTCLKPLRNY